MTSRDFESWMWMDAVRMLDRADRLQRAFFQPHSPRPAQWQPPVDVVEAGDAIWVIVALPGVAPDDIIIEIAGNTLSVFGERRVPAPARNGVLHRMEIPHGRFERHMRLPFPRLAIAGREFTDGCLYLKLREAEQSPGGDR